MWGPFWKEWIFSYSTYLSQKLFSFVSIQYKCKSNYSKPNLKRRYDARAARAPESMHSEKGSRKTVSGIIANRSFVHLQIEIPANEIFDHNHSLILCQECAMQARASLCGLVLYNFWRRKKLLSRFFKNHTSNAVFLIGG